MTQPAGEKGPEKGPEKRPDKGASTPSTPSAPAGEGATAASRPRSGALGEKQATPGPVIDMSRNPVGTAAVIAGVVLVVLGIIAHLMLFSSVTDVESLRRFTTVRDLLGIILGTGTVVLGIIGLTSRRTPRWGALVGLGVGGYVFLTSLASFVGSLMFD